MDDWKLCVEGKAYDFSIKQYIRLLAEIKKSKYEQDAIQGPVIQRADVETRTSK